MEISPGITLIPILHGRAVFGNYIRHLCNKEHYDCIAVDFPEIFEKELIPAVDDLPIISAVTAVCKTEFDTPLYYIPTDPCDAEIEGIRQARQNHIECSFIGYPELYNPEPLPPLPDEYAINKIGFDAYSSLCIYALGKPEYSTKTDQSAQYIAFRLHQLHSSFKNILVLIHFRHIVQTVSHFKQERTYNLSFPRAKDYIINTYPINSDHLYFALGELPFVTGLIEKERHDIFSKPKPRMEIIKDLFLETRDSYFSKKDDIIELSVPRIQAGLCFLRNLTIMENRFIPSLFDIVTTAKGIGGNSYAVHILKSSKYYPYFSLDSVQNSLSVGIDKVLRPGHDTPDSAVNLLRDTEMIWKTLSIKPDPSELRKREYRYSWNPYGMCSHLPEDRYIENFNTHIRTKAVNILSEDYVKTEPFETSVKDGIDIKETLHNWHTGKIYVKEIPPSIGNVDTVIIIFDQEHDERYPQQSTWYAEHEKESTLTFYGTDPFEDMVGPGIARCFYGGLSLLFPPRPVPSAFEMTKNLPIKKLSYRLTCGSLLFSKEHSVAYISTKKPDVHLKKIASNLKKKLIWIPISSFSTETLRKLRQFHVLNGKKVRSWASRFIGR